MLVSSLVSAQDSTRTDSLEILEDDTRIISADNAFLQNPNVKPQVKKEPIQPWQKNFNSYSILATDSTLRWQIWPNWGDFYAYRKDVLSFRQGTTGRTDAFVINGYSPYEQEYYLDGISLQNPITGLTNLNYVPQHKVAKVYESYEGKFSSNILMRDYYINVPISFLNYDESSAEYRNLEFMVAQNFNPSTNVEVSYWDRRDGGFYPNNEVQGSQLFAKVYHHLTEEWRLKGILMRNQFENDESFGYVVNNPTTFPFAEFGSQPKSTNGSSKTTDGNIFFEIQHRADSSSKENYSIFIERARYDRNLRFTGDTLSWKLTSYGLGGKSNFDFGNLNLRSNFSALTFSNDRGNSVSKASWQNFNASARAAYSLFDKIELFGKAEADQRSGSDLGYLIGVGTNLNINQRVKLNLFGSTESKAPTIQSLYWNGNRYFGNPDLSNEMISSIYGDIEFNISTKLKLGTSGRLRNSSSTIIRTDSSFVNNGDISTAFGNVFAQFESSRLEIESAASTEIELSSSLNSLEQNLNFTDTKVWIRNSIFYKTYAFNRAAYIKMGLRTLVSPFGYGSRLYNTELNFWQKNSTEQNIIPFFRMDAELSARVRGIFVLLRYENALDGVGQAGYFEASTFPMQPRRLVVGIRAQFRN